MRPFPVLVLGFLFVSFHPTLFRSHSCSTGAYLPLSLPVFPLPFRALVDRFLSGSGYSASVSSFPFLPDLRLTAAISVLTLPLSLPGVSSSAPPSFPCFASDSKYSASCSFPFVLPSFAPAAVSLVLTLCFRFRSFPLASAFFRPLPPGSDYSASALSFPFTPASPTQRFFPVPIYPRSQPPVSMRPFPVWYSAFCSSFLPLRFASQRLTLRPDLPFGLARSP